MNANVNTSWVRKLTGFENTLKDLKDCREHLFDDDLSNSEKAARESLVKLCEKISDEADTFEDD